MSLNDINNYKIRDLTIHDDISILEELTELNINVSKYDLVKTFIDSLNENHKIVVIEINNNENEKIIVGMGTVFIEQKLIHCLGKVGHIEDIIILKTHRHLGIGKHLVRYLIDYCYNNGCYKVILNCNSENIIFYEKCGMNVKGYEMCVYF